MITQNTKIHAPQDSGVPEYARDFSVKDRTVIITGSGQGIGREFARQFAAAGASVVVADLNEEKARRVTAEIENAGGRAIAVQTDVGDKQSVETLAAETMTKYGRIDALVNNAAIFSTLEKRSFDRISVDEWDRVMRVNVTGSFLCACAVTPHMREAKWGRIINISSAAVPLGVTNYLHYVASKSAIVGITNAMARELGPDGITVNAIRPGGVATEVERTANPTMERRIQLLTLQCLPRGQEPADLAGLVMFLVTPAAGFITGQTIACDGGFTHGS